MSDIIRSIEKAQLRTDLPEFSIGDTIRVWVKVVEGERERLQAFEGTVMARRNGSVRETFTVRRVSYGIGVERTFPAAFPARRPHRGHPQGQSAQGEAVLPAQPAGQGREDQGSQPRVTRGGFFASRSFVRSNPLSRFWVSGFVVFWGMFLSLTVESKFSA